MANRDDVKLGKKILLDGQPYEVTKAEHVKQARGAGMERCTIKNLLTGKVIPKTFRESDVVEEANVVYYSSEYTYQDAEGYHFMNRETYEDIVISAKNIGDSKFFLVEGANVKVMEWNGNPVNIELPPSVALRVDQTPPGEKGNSVNNNLKPATLETGLEIKIPLFIDQDEIILVDTRTNTYLSKA